MNEYLIFGKDENGNPAMLGGGGSMTAVARQIAAMPDGEYEARHPAKGSVLFRRHDRAAFLVDSGGAEVEMHSLD